jgi:hypothetical protein
MNKKKTKTNQFRQLFNYLLYLGWVTLEGSQNNISNNNNKSQLSSGKNLFVSVTPEVLFNKYLYCKL